MPGHCYAQSSADQSDPPASSSNQSSAKPPQQSKSPDESKPQKLWTNDNIGSANGSISIVGGSSSQSDVRAPGGGRQPIHGPGTIVSPPDGTIVAPGGVMHIEVEVPSGRSYGSVAAVSPLGFSDIVKSPPYILTLEIPTDARLRREPVTVIGAVEGKNADDLAEMMVDVERSDLPSKLWSQWSNLLFALGGEEIPLDVVAMFPDGSSYDASESSFMKYQSSNPNVATVSEYGIVKSVGPGEAWILAAYRGEEQGPKLWIKVSFTKPPAENPPAPQ